MDQLYFEQCEKYLLGKMTPQEKSDFELELNSNDALQQQLGLAKAIVESAALSAKSKVKTELEEIHQKHFPSTATKSHGNRKLWLALILILLLASSIGYMLSKKSWSGPIEPKQLYAQNFTPPELDLTLRSSTENPVLAQINTYYQNQQYATIIQSLNDKDSLIQSTPAISLVLAISYLETDVPDFAVNTLSQLATNPFYTDQAQWYLALAYLKNNDIQNAKKTLQIIANGNTTFKTNAQSLLSKL